MKICIKFNMFTKLLKPNKFNDNVKLFCQRSAFFSDKKHKSQSEREKGEIESNKEDMQWRPKPYETPDAWESKFKLFSDDNQTSDFISIMQQPIDLRPKTIKNWWKKRNIKIEKAMQAYMPERHAALGSDLAATHFILYRGGAVKFTNSTEWVRYTTQEESNLPNQFDPNYKVKAIKCDDMELYYEGLENLKRLQHLKLLSFVNVKTFDDWCLDRVSGLQNPNLEVLDLTGTSITHRGLSCIYRLDSLKLLVLDDPKSSKEMELSCALLEVDNPYLKITSSKQIHDI